MRTCFCMMLSLCSALGSVCLSHISRNKSDPREEQTQNHGNGAGENFALGVGRGSKEVQLCVLPSPGRAPVPQQPGGNCRGLGFPLC